MMASSCRHRILVPFALVGFALVGLACRPGLPPVPPESDPANPAAPIPEWEPSTAVLDASAFEGEAVDEGGHDDGAHGHMGHATEKPANTDRTQGGAHEHEGHPP